MFRFDIGITIPISVIIVVLALFALGFYFYLKSYFNVRKLEKEFEDEKLRSDEAMMRMSNNLAKRKERFINRYSDKL